MAGKNRDGTWEALAGLTMSERRALLIRKRKRGKLAGWRMRP